jgi:hypothetical protein
MPSPNTLVTLVPADGSQVSTIDLGPAGLFHPIEGTNHIQVPSWAAPSLIAGGFQYVVASGTVHVP